MTERVIAILEDDERRREAMLARMAGARIELFARAHDMIAWLGANAHHCALVSLDHDLVELERGVDAGTGLDVVLFLCERTPLCPVIVHTSNPHAAPGMMELLESRGWLVRRVPPYNDLEWVEAHWQPTVRELLGESDELLQEAVFTLTSFRFCSGPE